MARVYADINERMPRSYWDYDSVNISWGVLENYEVVRKIGMSSLFIIFWFLAFSLHSLRERGNVEGNSGG